jgi:hypothetical protein
MIAAACFRVYFVIASKSVLIFEMIVILHSNMVGKVNVYNECYSSAILSLLENGMQSSRKYKGTRSQSRPDELKRVRMKRIEVQMQAKTASLYSRC